MFLYRIWIGWFCYQDIRGILQSLTFVGSSFWPQLSSTTRRQLPCVRETTAFQLLSMRVKSSCPDCCRHSARFRAFYFVRYKVFLILICSASRKVLYYICHIRSNSEEDHLKSRTCFHRRLHPGTASMSSDSNVVVMAKSTTFSLSK